METFQKYLNGKDLKASTIKDIIDKMARLQRYSDLENIASIKSYLSSLKVEGRSNVYLNRLIVALRHYGKFTNNKELTNYPLYKEKRKPTIRETLTLEEIEMIITAPKYHNSSQHDMWSLYFEVLATTGCRCGEIAKLQDGGSNRVDYTNRCLILEDTKTIGRIVPIPSLLADKLNKHNKSVKGYYFTKATKDEPIANEQWGSEFRARAKRQGITRKNLSTYSFRHSYITYMIDNDVDIFTLMTLVGHQDPKVTMNYYHTNLKKLRKGQDKNPYIQQQMTYAGKVREIVARFDSDMVNIGVEDVKRYEVLTMVSKVLT